MSGEHASDPQNERTGTGAPFVVLAQREISPDNRDAFLEIDDSLMRDASEAPGFDTVWVLQKLEDPNYIVHFELWDDQASHDEYVMDTTHEEFESEIEDMVERVHDPQHYRVLGRYESGEHPVGPLPDSTLFDTDQTEPRGTGPGKRAAPLTAATDRNQSSRLAPADQGDMSADAQALLEDLPPLTFFRVIVRAEPAFTPFMRLASALLNEGTIHPRLREMTILAIARLEHAEYEWVQHEPLAREAGVTDQQIKLLRQMSFDAPILNDDERLVLAFAEAWCEQGIVDDELFAEAKAQLGPDGVTELMILCGFYRMAGQIMANAELPPESPPSETVDIE